MAANSAEARPAVRRLRSTVASDIDDNNAESDLASLAFVTSSAPNPALENLVQVPGDDRTRLKLTVVNNSRHTSPNGGITLSFPDLTSPADRARITNIEVPEGMALHVIPSGGQLFGRNGREQVASHLMIEVHGPWQSRQSRTLVFEILGTDSPITVRYRSAFSDRDGEYHNTPIEAETADQQGWPALACRLGPGTRSFAGQGRASAGSVETGTRP